MSFHFYTCKATFIIDSVFGWQSGLLHTYHKQKQLNYTSMSKTNFNQYPYSRIIDMYVYSCPPSFCSQSNTKFITHRIEHIRQPLYQTQNTKNLFALLLTKNLRSISRQSKPLVAKDLVTNTKPFPSLIQYFVDDEEHIYCVFFTDIQAYKYHFAKQKQFSCSFTQMDG